MRPAQGARPVKPIRAALLRGVSAFALVTALGVSSASAQSAANVRAIAGLGAATIPPPPQQTQPQNLGNGGAMNSATLRALQYQARVNQAVDLAQQAQDAARQAAQALSVPNGLGIGGLDPVTMPVPAAEDATGLHTWQGADAPQQTTSSSDVNVTIKQTDQRAILSWETFNVGSHTTVTFDQSQDGKAQPGWVALNRVVGQLDPLTGLRDPNSAPAPSLILGTIKASGTVLVLNQNGVIFGPTSQINTHSLVATSLEVGRAFDPTSGALSIKQRNDEFLNFGLLGYADQATVSQKQSAFTFSAQAIDGAHLDPMLEGSVEIQAGAKINTDAGGFVLLAAPKVINSGHIVSPLGEVALQSGRELTLQRSEGAASSDDPNVRGFLVIGQNRNDSAGNFVQNASTGWIEAPQGYISLAATQNGALLQQGLLQSTTSVSRNGYIRLYAGDIKIDTGSTISILPDDSKQTIPQDPVSLGDFKSSKIAIGNSFNTAEQSLPSRIEIDSGSMLYAPGADVRIGSTPGLQTVPDSQQPGTSRIFIDSGAIIDVAGLVDVLIPASRNSIEIDPVKKNELRDSPDYKDSFLNGAKIFVDPRFSGVRDDGVAWVGSPLIEAESYYQQVGVTASELMTKGGNITMSVSSAAPGSDPSLVPDIITKPGAIIDMSGGWVKYEAGFVKTSTLINAYGQVVDVAAADPNDVYVGVYEGYSSTQARWGVTQTWANPLLSGGHYDAAYTEGRDAGSLTIKSSSLVLDGTLLGQAYAGSKQLADARAGTATSTLLGDKRLLQGAPSQLPSGAFLFIQALGQDASGNVTGGADVSIVSDYAPVDSGLTYGQSIGVDASNNLVLAPRDPLSLMPVDRRNTISLSSDALSQVGLSQLTIDTSGSLAVTGDASLNLNAGGVFDATAGRTITVDGSITAQGGRIFLETTNAGFGNIFAPTDAGPGSFDVIVNGMLSTRGRWANDMGANPDSLVGGSFINGGKISIISAPRVSMLQETATADDTRHHRAPEENVDISGSILINSGARLDVSGGGYVRDNGTFDLSGRGGDIALINDTNYFQLADDATRSAGGVSGFRVSTILNTGGNAVVAVNPSAINARVTIADGTILAHGFAGGGTFTLHTPQFDFGDETPTAGTELPLDFISKTGFSNYNIVSYKTDLVANNFNNGLGGYNAVLATQVVTVGDGQTLSLSQSQFSPLLDDSQIGTLRGLQTGGDLYSVMSPVIPDDAWDRKAANLTLGGLMELHVAQGGRIEGEAGAILTVPQLFNEGTIRIAGGQIIQSEVLPGVYIGNNALGVRDLADVFTTNANGFYSETGKNALGIRDANGVLTNAQVAAQYRIYLLGDLDAGEGVRLSDGSVTDLSGTSIINPRAPATGHGNIQSITDGKMIAGGTLASLSASQLIGPLFHAGFGVSVFGSQKPTGVRTASAVNAVAGSVLDLSGASDVFDQLQLDGSVSPTPVWSDAGTLYMGSGGTITGADIRAFGGAPDALGGTLVVLDPVLTQGDPAAPAKNAISASMIASSGFDTFVAQGSVTSQGDVTLALGNAFFLTSRPFSGLGGQDLNNAQSRDSLAPVVRSGGIMEIDAPYIAFDSDFQTFSSPNSGTVGTNSAIFRADMIDITGAVLFDRSVADVQLIAQHDMRLTGVQPWQHTFNLNPETVPNSLIGQLAVNGNLEITVGQVYPTTGSTFTVTSASPTGTITFARSSASDPLFPYSAGGNLAIQAAQIVQGGVIRVPVGHLTLGGNMPLTLNGQMFAPATQSVHVLDGSITSVSGNGLIIPYGTTTDQIEWFFEPTGSDSLKAPPTAVLNFGGASVALDSGATVDISGGGDLYAYEFVPGTGGSRDVLDRFNADPFSSHNGEQFPDGRQVYAIVPGLSDATAAAFDPIYSADYADLYSSDAVGKRVYLSGGAGLAPGWYTLLPAKYAMLPGGMRVVEQSASAPLPTGSGKLNDGSLIVTGYYGDAGAGSRESTIRTFSVMSQDVFRKYSNIATTTANAKFSADAAKSGLLTPRLPIDAGRLILNPAITLAVNTTLDSDAGKDGRGAQVDISGKSFDIVSDLPATPPANGTIVLTADSLTNLDASSLLIGGVRTDNSDGTTSLAVTAQNITVENDAAHPLKAPEVVLAVDGSGSGITVKDGASVLADGTFDDQRTGDYLINGGSAGMTGQGAVLRVSTGPERQVTRTNIDNGTTGGLLSVGDASLSGNSLLLESSGDLKVSPTASIKASDLAIGAGKVTFSDDPSITTGLVITSALQRLFGEADQLTIRTPRTINFSAGNYTFGNLRLDTPGLLLLDGNAVTLHTDTLTLSNSSAAVAACSAVGAPSCGSGNLSIDSDSILFGSGTVRTFGFGGTQSLSATNGIFFNGNGAYDAGIALVAIHTPFLGDQAVPFIVGQDLPLPSFAFTTSGNLSVSGSGGTGTAPDGIPGAALTLSGNDVSISDTRIRATAGTLNVSATGKLDVLSGAIIETPGYSKVFGDSADPVTVSAPGGTLSLVALGGDIDLANGATLSIGGGKGRAGTLKLQAADGDVYFGATLDTNAPDGGGSLLLDQKGAFDLADLETLTQGAFTGTIGIRTGTGDLLLASDQTLKAENVELIADSGSVDIAGTVDVSGTNGGDISLFGQSGVTLEGTAKLDAHAAGYALTDTRQARGGDIELGTDGTGTISVASGAKIDVRALHTDDRLVPTVRNGVTYYNYVPGDLGGTVTFRAPIIEQAGSDTVKVNYAGKITGARQIVLEGFQHFDLADIASNPDFVGVTINGAGQAVLDLAATGAGSQHNFLADNASGTLVDFVQNFDISKANGHLGDLATQSNFHERPGMELDYTGDVVLNSNWNLGAGTVDVAGAVAAGLMAPQPSLPGQYYVIPGKEAELFQHFTHLTYRTDGAVDGEPGILTIRAGGNFDAKGSITDGFFQLRDQTDPGYLNVALGGGQAVYTPFVGTACFGGTCDTIAHWQALGILPPSYVSIVIPSAGGLGGLLQNPAPYSAAANSPAALGSLPGNTGDPLGSAELFPRLALGSGNTKPVESWSYRLVGGSDLASVDPMQVAAGATGNVIVEGEHPYSYAALNNGTSTFDDSVLLRAGTDFVTPDEWLQAFIGVNPSLDGNAYTFINLASAPPAVRDFLISQATTFFASHPGQFQVLGPATKPTGISTTLALAAKFMNDVFVANFDTLKANYNAPQLPNIKKPATATAPTIIRTGSGDITVAAAGDIDLRNGDTATFRKLDGSTATPAQGGLQVGGTAIYTAGYRADLVPRTVVDAITHATFTIDPTGHIQESDFFGTPLSGGYRYGAGATPDVAGAGYTGILIADPVYAEGGGDVSVSAGRDVKGRRNIWQEARLATYYDRTAGFGYSWIGTSDQAWRSGTVGMNTNIRIDPQLFSEGVGALGGGDVSVHAGRDISDLSIVSDTSVTTADVTSGATATRALWTVGGGNVDVAAGRDLVGGRLDVASGSGTVTVGGSVKSGGTIQVTGVGAKDINDLRVRVSDASVAIVAGQTVALKGIASLGVLGTSSDFERDLNGRGFYSPISGVSVLANGSISVDNIGNDVVSPSDKSTELTRTAIWPGSFSATSMTSDLSLVGPGVTAASGIVLYPSPIGQLVLLAGGDIAPVTISMDDGDPGLLPGYFSSFHADPSIGLASGRTFIFSGVLPNTSDVERRALHNASPTHAGDANPVRVAAGGDIVGLIISVPKAARISAGRDLINAMFFGQNLTANDITRIVAGRDITATTTLLRPLQSNGQFGTPLAALQGNTFVIGGPGSFFLEAGRDAGPFLNSATTDGFVNSGGALVHQGEQSYAGGILSVGNDWNPWLDPKGADLYVLFGVAKGAQFDAFRDFYLDPANLSNLDGDLFEQVKDASGNLTPDRNKPIYAPVLVQWMKNNASTELIATYGTADVTYQEAYDTFNTLPELQQRVFILANVYFNELTSTSIPTGPSYKQYSRGYRAIETLFPSLLGYTQNDLSGGGNGASTTVQTGDLDLRLATIQTTRGGNVYILGPGGRVLAGSTVRTAQQADRRAYDGGRLFAGNITNSPIIAAIDAIPVGSEGILTLRGGSIFTFTDRDFLLNQSRLFTEDGGSIAMWSSNGDLNAGQGPKTAANFPPVVVKVDGDLFSEVDSVGAVSGAGIAAFQPSSDVPPPDVFLIAPRGTVDAGDAGVRVAGNLYIAAQSVANAENFSVGGSSFGIPAAAAVDVNVQTGANATAAAASQAAQAVAGSQSKGGSVSIITVDVIGYAGSDAGDEEERKRKRKSS